jgi:nanoRNase/pAp phosphatase (c-di-AMP/oligoRNAs hydrolase)
MNEKTPRSQLAAKVKSASNILVTVSHDPSVDQLAAALGLTILLAKMDKHVTAVFSGKIPSALNFLEPEKTFENSVDSLRDFVISLDKEKADRLRYKVEGDFVKIYITPYRTVISEKDLEFNEGDFNIELVIAVGVEEKDHLDGAITAHGKLLHDATVATLNLTTDDKSAFGTINWQDNGASSLSEMIANLTEDLSDEKNPLLDEQIATALLTGVVAATDQFRNEKTSANTMTLAANLMAKGANQQLIASELSAGTDDVATDSSEEVLDDTEEVAEPPAEEALGELSLNHDAAPSETETTNDQLAADAEAVAFDHSNDALAAAQEDLANLESAQNAAMEAAQSAEPVVDVPALEPEPVVAPEPAPDLIPEPVTIPEPEPVAAPTLVPVTDSPAVTAPAAAPGEAELDNLVANNNSAMFSHSTPYAESVIDAPLNAAVAGSEEPASVDPFTTTTQLPPVAPMINTTPTPATVSPLPSPGIDLPPPPPPPVPDLGQLPPPLLGEPTVEALPPLPAPELAPPMTPAQDVNYATPPAANPMFPSVDPTQYQIPDQQ